MISVKETGEIVSGVTAVTWDWAVGEAQSTLRLEIRGVEVDLESMSSADIADGLADIARGLA